MGTQILADYGADVIKVERPPRGDWSRAWGPFIKGVSLPFANLNRNKRSLAVDLKSQAGRELAGKLMAETDVVVHNFRKGVMEKLGFGYEDARAVNPGLIYAWSSGWGDSGPSADCGRGGHDLMARAEAGWFLQPDKDNAPIPGGMSADYTAGLHLMMAILMALYHREKTGQGQFISTDLFSVAFHAHIWDGASQMNGAKIDAPAALGGIEEAILKAFATKDGYIEISPVFSDNALRDISLALGLNDLSEDPRFATEKKQLKNRETLNALLAERFRARTTETWMAELEPQGIFCARVHTFAEATEHPQTAPNNLIVEMEHPEAGDLKLSGTPIRLQATPPQLRHPPPDLGEHSTVIARELGYTQEEIDRLVENGVLVTSAP